MRCRFHNRTGLTAVKFSYIAGADCEVAGLQSDYELTYTKCANHSKPNGDWWDWNRMDRELCVEAYVSEPLASCQSLPFE